MTWSGCCHESRPKPSYANRLRALQALRTATRAPNANQCATECEYKVASVPTSDVALQLRPHLAERPARLAGNVDGQLGQLGHAVLAGDRAPEIHLIEVLAHHGLRRRQHQHHLAGVRSRPPEPVVVVTADRV